MDLQPSIRLVATAHPEPGSADRTWGIRMFTSQGVLERTIKDPFDDVQHSECQWYLDNYAQNDSMEKGRANKIEWQLGKYAKNLASQLDLSLTEDSNLDLEICETDLEDNVSKGTIHQIYWELLEDASAWGLQQICLRVRRMRSSEPTDLCPQSTLQEKPKIINILHIVARDSENLDDVNPIMSLGILTDINRELKSRGSGVQLNIESIKPASLKQLSRHLLSLRGQHRNQDIHIIHLDVHGDADMAGSSLYLEDVKTGRTTPHAVEKIAAKFNINSIASPFLVLNACQSAVARHGDFANTAKVFSKMGCAENVLAMSFTALETAASLFLHTFYEQLILHGQTFSHAAYAARCALRGNNLRDARFNRKLTLLDWFAPVVYSSVQDTPIVSPNTIEQVVEGTRPPQLQDTNTTETACGRAFDLSTLERVLSQSRMVYLYGHAWIGKSTFLRYAQRIWEQTALADSIVCVDLSQGLIQDVTNLAIAILKQLSLSVAEDRDQKAAVLEHIRNKTKVLIIIDGLHAMFSAFEKILVPLKVGEKSLAEFDAFFRDLTDACDGGEKQSLIIFSGRSPPLPRRRAAQAQDQPFYLSFDSRFKAMELEELTPADALQLCQESIRPADPTSVNFINGSMLFSRLLLGSPGLMSTLGSECKRNGVVIAEFTASLQQGECTLYQSLSNLYTMDGGVFSELHVLLRGLKWTELFVLLVLGGLFWHQGPYTVMYTDFLSSFGICNQPEVVSDVIEFASERGYIRTRSVQKVQRISFIHPGFSIYCRFILQQLYQSRISKPGITTSPMSRSLPETLVSSITEQSIQALQDLSALFKQAEFSLPSDWKPIHWFLQDIADQRTFSIATENNVGLGHRIQPNHLANHLQNALTCIRLCVDESLAISPDRWPLQYLMHMCIHVLAAGTQSERSLFTRQYDSLLNHLFQIAPELMATDWELQRFAVTITVNMLVMLRTNSIFKKEPQQWMNRINAILQARQCVNPTEGDAVFLLAQRLCDMATGNIDHYSVDWKGFFKKTRSYNEAAQNLLRDDQLRDFIPRVINSGENGVQDARSMLHSHAAPFIEAADEKILDIVMCFTPDENENRGHNSKDNDETQLQGATKAPMQTIFEDNNLKELLNLISESHLDQGHDGVPLTAFLNGSMSRAFDQWRNAERLNVDSFMSIFEDQASGMDMIEAATNSGNWVSAIRSHRFLIDSSRMSGNIALTGEHIEELVRLLRSANDPQYEAEITRYQNMKHILDTLTKVAYMVNDQCKVNTAEFYKLIRQSQSNLMDILTDETQRHQATAAFTATNALLDKVGGQMPTMDPEEWNDFMKGTQNIASTEDPARVFGLVQELATWKGLAMDAVAKDDTQTALLYYTKLGEAYANDSVAAFILGPEFAKCRSLMTWPIEWGQTVLDWTDAVNAPNFELADRLLVKIKTLAEEYRTSSAFSDVPDERKKKTWLYYEMYDWTHICYKAAHQYETDPRTAFRALDGALNRTDDFYNSIAELNREQVGQTAVLAATYRVKCVMAFMGGPKL